MTDTDSLVLTRDANFKERMIFTIERLGGLRAASILVGVTEDSLANWRNGRVNPNFNKMKELAKAADVNLDWLAYGRGFSPLDTRDFIFIPYADFEPAGKKPLPIPDDRGHEDFSIRKEWVRHVLGIEQPENLVMTIAATDSMDPTIRIGDILLIDTTTTTFTSDAVTLFRMREATILRRIQTLATGTIILKADNPAYEEERLNAEEIQAVCVMGLVKWIGRRG